MDALLEAAHAAGVRDERVLNAIAAVPRAEFVPPAYAVQAEVDAPIPIPHSQVTTQPSLVARMVEALALEGDERVLEIGTRVQLGRPQSISPQLARRIRSMRTRGLTLQAICDRLNAEGIPTPRGGLTWRPTSLRAVLTCGD